MAKYQLAHVTSFWCLSASNIAVFNSVKLESKLLFCYILYILFVSICCIYYLHLYLLYYLLNRITLYTYIYINIQVKKRNIPLPTHAICMPSMYVSTSHSQHHVQFMMYSFKYILDMSSLHILWQTFVRPLIISLVPSSSVTSLVLSSSVTSTSSSLFKVTWLLMLKLKGKHLNFSLDDSERFKSKVC